MPTIMPLMAPYLFIRLSKMPRMMAGKNDEAASPKARATTCATNPGGFRPASPAPTTATAMATLAARTDVFGFVGTNRVRLQGSAVADSYDSRLGDYAQQVGYHPNVEREIAGEEGALLSNERIQVRNESVVHGVVGRLPP